MHEPHRDKSERACFGKAAELAGGVVSLFRECLAKLAIDESQRRPVCHPLDSQTAKSLQIGGSFFVRTKAEESCHDRRTPRSG
jgi:hypothetical protein